MALGMDEANEVSTPLEYVISLGTQGNHILFDTDRIRKAFVHCGGEGLDHLKPELVTQVREAINQIFAIPGVEGKREFLSALPPEVEDVLIHLYFQMIEKTMLVQRRQLH